MEDPFKYYFADIMHLVVNSENQAGIVAHLPNIANLEIVIELFQPQGGCSYFPLIATVPRGK